MARKKCPHCQTCYSVFWYNNNRYYSCWLCKIVLTGRDDSLYEVEDPRITLNIPIEESEQDDNSNNVTSIES